MHEEAGLPGPGERSVHGPDRISSLLVEWQSTGRQRALETLITATLSMMQACASRTLRRQGIADKSSVDDAICLVLDHLRRLPHAAAREAAVTPFATDRAEKQGGSADREAGTAYLLWITRERSLDVARARRRHDRHAVPFSIAGLIPARTQQARQPDEEGERLQAVLPRLEPRLRTVVEQLLAGATQADIARRLGFCEGTVSRLRGRAIAELRRLMRE